MNLFHSFLGIAFLVATAVGPLAAATPSAADQAALDLIKPVAPAQAASFEVDTSLPKIKQMRRC